MSFLQMVTIDFHETLSHVLTHEGAQIALEGSHEARVWNILPMKGEGTPSTVQEIQAAVGKESASVGQGRAFKAKWIGKEGGGFVKLVCPHAKAQEVSQLLISPQSVNRFLPSKMRPNWSFGKSILQVLLRRERGLWLI